MKKGYNGEDQLTISMFQKYIAWAKRTIHPVLTPEAQEQITNFYIETRTRDSDEDNSVPITARALEGLVRLAEANARMRLSPEATAEDAKRAVSRAIARTIGRTNPCPGGYLCKQLVLLRCHRQL